MAALSMSSTKQALNRTLTLSVLDEFSAHSRPNLAEFSHSPIPQSRKS
jgi:hypothetical protein